MTDTICESPPKAVAGGMKGTGWQMRLKALGITQARFAAIVDVTPTNLGIGLRGELPDGVPRYVSALILALEQMDDRQLAAWLAEAEN